MIGHTTEIVDELTPTLFSSIEQKDDLAPEQLYDFPSLSRFLFVVFFSLSSSSSTPPT